MIKLFTMVKDECDIIRDWITYHGYLFGYENLFIVDNISTDGTFEIINEFADKGVHIFKETDYKKKGDIMKKLIDTYCENRNTAFPLDIDEFIVYHEKGSKDIICDKQLINDYIIGLRGKSKIYKANYICSMITEKDGYERAACDNKWGLYNDYGSRAKSFFNVNLYKGKIDHGNHLRTDDYFLTNICLVHFHCRNFEQMRKKNYNNVVGLGYPDDLESLKKMIYGKTGFPGLHNIKTYISFLDGTFSINPVDYNENFIDLSELNKFFY